VSKNYTAVGQIKYLNRFLRPIFGLFLFFTISCAQESYQTGASGSNYFKIYSFDQQTNQGQFIPVLLENLWTVNPMSGQFAEFVYAPREQNSEIIGDSPKLNFIQNREGVWVPQNLLSMEVASLYFQFQNLYYFDKQLGFETLYKLPRKISVQTRIKSEKSNRAAHNNAFYEMNREIFFFLPTAGEGLQIPLNSGVIAHEHFHSLFHKLVLNKLKVSEKEKSFLAVHAAPIKDEDFEQIREEVLEIYNFIFLRALNEGLADYWGWLYSKDTHFIGRSLLDSENSRNLSEKSDQSWMQASILLAPLWEYKSKKIKKRKKNRNNKPNEETEERETEDRKNEDYKNERIYNREDYIARSYHMGAQLAREMVSMNNELAENQKDVLKSKEKLAGALLKFLEHFGSSLQGRLEKNEIVDPQIFLKEFIQYLEKQDPVFYKSILKPKKEDIPIVEAPKDINPKSSTSKASNPENEIKKEVKK